MARMTDDWTVRVAPGTGVVSRRGSTLLVAKTASAAQDDFLDELLALIATTVQAGGGELGRRLARKTAGLVGPAEPEDVPDFCLLAETDGGIAALVVGNADLDLGTGEVLSGRDVATWVDRIVRDPRTLTARVTPGATPDRRSDLHSGTVRGDGASLEPAGTPASASAAAAPAPAPTPAPAPALAKEPEPEDDAPPSSPFAPPPGASPASPFSPYTPSMPAGDGPGAGQPDERTQGISLMDTATGETPIEVGQRADLGFLVLDEGTELPLTRDYVVGREPDGAETVREGRAVPLVLADDEATLSRVHAVIEVVGQDVRVTDVGSANGTYVAARGDQAWTQLQPHEPVVIRPGTRISLGGRSLTFEPPRG